MCSTQVNDKLTGELPLFCPLESCSHYQKPDNTIKKDGIYRTQSDPIPRQMYYCHGGGHRFSETHYSELKHKQGSLKEYEQTAKLSCYGLASEQIADVLDRDVRTIEHWLSGLGKKSEHFHIHLCLTRLLILQFVQMDELWSYLKTKKHQRWVFISFELASRFWLGFELGSRTTPIANRLVAQFKRFGNWTGEKILKVTTDKLAAYKNALEKHFTNRPYHYLQLVKRRVKRHLVTVKKRFVKGTEEDFPEKTQNTSYIERFNLTLRQHVSYLTRKTLGYCKSKQHFKQILWINLFNYNYIQFHQSLRTKINNRTEKFTKKYQRYTPAMKIGLTQSVLTWRDLIIVPIPISH
jgi:IS1 family transposase